MIDAVSLSDRFRADEMNEAMVPDITALSTGIGASSDRSMWWKLKQILEYQIAIGNYPVGAKLPGVRNLARALGVNKNTVSRAYVELRREGLVESVKGKGVIVINLPKLKDLEKVADELAQRVTILLQEAMGLGLDPGRIRQVLWPVLDSCNGSVFPHAAVVECNEVDARHFASELSTQLSIPFQPVVLPKSLPKGGKLLREFDFVVTPLFHLNEVSAVMEDCPGEVEGVLLAPDIKVILELAKMSSTLAIGLVALGDRKRTVSSLADLLRSYTSAKVKACAIYDADALHKLFDASDVLVDTLACHDELMKMSPHQRVITLNFGVDQQSRDYLRYRIRTLQRRYFAVSEQPFG